MMDTHEAIHKAVEILMALDNCTKGDYMQSTFMQDLDRMARKLGYKNALDVYDYVQDKKESWHMIDSWL